MTADGGHYFSNDIWSTNYKESNKFDLINIRNLSTTEYLVK